MGIFDFLKKKEEGPSYDPTNLQISDLNAGWIFDYDLKSWRVVEVGQYDWGSNNFTREFLIDSGTEKKYLSLEGDEEPFLTLSSSIKIRKLGESIVEDILKDNKPPDKLVYKNVTYFLDEDSAGYYRDLSKNTEDWEELISWDYYDKEEEKTLNITQWGEREFEASAGIVLKPHEISNIIPSN